MRINVQFRHSEAWQTQHLVTKLISARLFGPLIVVNVQKDVRKNAFWLDRTISPHTVLTVQCLDKWKVNWDSWFSSTTFLNEKHRQDSVLSASCTITHIKPSGHLAKTSAANGSQPSFKKDTPFHCLWRYPWQSSDEGVLSATTPDDSEMLHY